MKTTVTKRHWALLGVSVAVCVGVWTGFRVMPSVNQTTDAELAALLAERGRLEGASDQTRDEWRQKAAASDRHRWSPAMREELEASVGRNWHWVWQPSDAGQQTAVLSTEGAGLQDWPGVLAVLRNLETRPGLTVEKFEIRASGTGTNRRFPRIAVTLHIAVMTNRNPAWAASLAPRPVSGLSVSARSREVGRAAPLAGRVPPPAQTPSRRPGPSAGARPTTREHGLFVY